MSTPESHDDALGMDPKNLRDALDALSVADTPHASDGTPAPGGGPGRRDDSAGAGETVDEAALRALMQGAVAGLQGSPDALERLRRAVPLRRQRRRQAVVGAAAAVLLAGLSVPALLRAATSEHGTHATVASVHGSHTGAPNEDGHADAWGGTGGHPGGQPSGSGSVPTHQPPATGGTDTPPVSPTIPSDSDPPAPACTSTQLGEGTSQTDAPDTGGRVYGWFKVANVSGSPCTVPNGGVVQAVTQGAADPSKIQVVDHTAGDTAAELPTAPPSGPVVLSPGERYEVAFAWVPAGDGPGGCPVAPTTTPAAPPTPTDTAPTVPTGSSDPGSMDSGNPGNTATTQLGEDTPSPPAAGSLVLNHTPAAGAPVVDSPVIPNACAGTVYTTAAIPEPDGTPAS